MRIGILTFHDTSNFGAMLQTYGLYKCIVNMGHECEVINYQNEAIRKREIPPSWHFSLNPKELLKELLIYPNDRKRYKGISSFMNKRILMTEPFTRANIGNVEKKYDILMVGSDMVWALNITNEDYSYFLDFASDSVLKCSFGSSIGKEWTDDQKEIIKSLLASFSYISVREAITSQWLKEFLKREIDVVSDPTMLLEPSEWVSIKSDRYKQHDYILVYFDDTNGNCLKSAIQTGKEKHLPVYVVNGYRPSVHYKNVDVYTIEDFLSIIYYAKYVYTASYHGLLFSLYFEKTFAYFEREPAARMKYIAERIGLKDRNGVNVYFNIDNPIDYSAINREIADFRSYSIERLSEIVSDGRSL